MSQHNGPAAENEPPQAGAADPARPGFWTAAGYGVSPGPLHAPAGPAAPRPRGRNAAWGAAWGGAAIALLLGLMVFAFIKHLNSTGSVRVIVPAPAAAGGLRQDYADENTSQFRSYVAALHQRVAARLSGGSFTAAIYTSARPGEPARNARSAVLFLGLNAPSASDPAGGIRSAMSGAARGLTNVTVLKVGGGPGDTAFECETGSTALGGTAVLCGWTTDRTLGMLLQLTPGTGAPQLAALTKKMMPDLVRG